jgi:hypothetical protein
MRGCDAVSDWRERSMCNSVPFGEPGSWHHGGTSVNESAMDGKQRVNSDVTGCVRDYQLSITCIRYPSGNILQNYRDSTKAYLVKGFDMVQATTSLVAVVAVGPALRPLAVAIAAAVVSAVALVAFQSSQIQSNPVKPSELAERERRLSTRQPSIHKHTHTHTLTH